MKISIYKSLLIIVILLFIMSSGPVAHSENLQVNFGVTFRNARLVPLWITDEEGYFKKQGLDVKQVNISGGTQGAQMMVSGGVDVSYDDPITCIVSTAGSVPVNVIVGGTHERASASRTGGPTAINAPRSRRARHRRRGAGSKTGNARGRSRAVEPRSDRDRRSRSFHRASAHRSTSNRGCTRSPK